MSHAQGMGPLERLLRFALAVVIVGGGGALAIWWAMSMPVKVPLWAYGVVIIADIVAIGLAYERFIGW